MDPGLEEIKVFKVFLSCPEDIVEHGIKDVVERVFEEDNIYFKSLGFIFELKHWKKNVCLGKGTPRVQDRINQILLKRCDIYLGILWTRFGSSPGPDLEGMSYSSGTEEEFYFAKSLDKELWFLFCRYKKDPYKVDPEQFNKVKEFRKQLEKEQIWYAEFYKEDELKEILKENISNFINEKYIKVKEREDKLQSLPSRVDFSKYSRGFEL